MALENQQFTLSLGPPAKESAISVYLGARSDIFDPISLGHDRHPDSIPLSTCFGPERACGNTLPSSILVGRCDVNATVPRRRHSAGAYIHHSRNVLDGSSTWPTSSSKHTAGPSTWSAIPRLEIPRVLLTQESGDSTHTLERHPQALTLSLKSLEVNQKQLVLWSSSMYPNPINIISDCPTANIIQQIHEAISLNPNDQCQALNGYLLIPPHLHQDVLSTTQHSTNTPLFQQLIHKYIMPAQVWRYETYSFLELQHRLANYSKFLLTFCLFYIWMIFSY